MTMLQVKTSDDKDVQILTYNIGMHCNTCNTGTVVSQIFFTDKNIQVQCTKCRMTQFYRVEKDQEN